MTRYLRTQCLAERLIRHACRRLPDDIRDERYREWIAEVPAILDDQYVRFAARRITHALLFAADHHRGAQLPRNAASRPTARTLRLLASWLALSTVVSLLVGAGAGYFYVYERYLSGHGKPDISIPIYAFAAVAALPLLAILMTWLVRRRRSRDRAL